MEIWKDIEGYVGTYQISSLGNVKSLNYIWQIEWKNEKIKSFYIPRDWEINLLSESWIYKINFEIKDEKLIIR